MSTPKKLHIAARMGHWSATHRKTAIFGWLGFVIVAFAIGTFVVTQQQIVYETSQPGESGRAEKILYEDFKQPAGESILIQHPELLATNPAFQAVVQDVVSSAEDIDVVAKVESPLDAENSGQVSDDGHAVLVELEIAGESDKAIDKIDPVVAQIKEVQSANPDFYIGWRRRQHREGRPGSLLRRSGQGGAHLDSDHPDHPDRRVRSARRSGDPAPAGHHGHPRDHGPHFDLEPVASDGGSRRRDGPADRARCRGRLLDVLFEA